MARRYSRKKGKSGSTKPLKKVKPSWAIYEGKEVEQLIIKLSKSGKSMSEIGMILRDSYGIPDVKVFTHKSISKILDENKMAQGLPEDLVALIKKHILIMKHRETNNRDMTSKRGLQLTESKIQRLVKYYKRTGRIPQNWNYDPSKAKLLLES